MPTTRVLLLRHGQSVWNAEGRWQGWADPPLTELGEQQARDVVEHLRGAGLTRAVSSDLQRARRTAEILAAGLGLGAVEVEPDVREHGVGLFQGHTGEENMARFPDAFDANGRIVKIPEGEPDTEVIGRVLPALLRIARRHPDERVLVATHGGVIRIVERHFGIERGFSLPNLGGRWFDVCDGGRIDPLDVELPLDPHLLTEPKAD